MAAENNGAVTTGAPDHRASAWLEIDLAALADNYNRIRACAAPSVRCAAMVKADGYGLGAKQVTDTLLTQGCRDFFVATLAEGLSLRAHMGRIIDQTGPVTLAVLGGLFPGAEPDYVAAGLVPVLSSPDDIMRWRTEAKRQEKILPAIIHIDTGMNRLGLSAAETKALLDDPQGLDGIKVLLVMSHFACADEPDDTLTPLQYQRFQSLSAGFGAVPRSLANSFGIFRDSAYHFDLLRPGMALYGLNPVPGRDNPMRHVVSLKARILQVRQVEKGEHIGYGATYRFENPGHIATVGLGYGDGFLRALGGRGTLYYDGVPCPIRGRVSMDLTGVDISHIDPLPRQGDVIEIIGPHQSADTLADHAGTIGYEILTNLGSRYHRTYRGLG